MKPADVAAKTLSTFFTYRDEHGLIEQRARAAAIGEVSALTDCPRAISEAITLICSTYAYHYQRLQHELGAIAATQRELGGEVSFDAAGVLGRSVPSNHERPSTRSLTEDFEAGHGGFGKGGGNG